MKQKIVLAAAVVAGLLAAFLTGSYISSRERALQAEKEAFNRLYNDYYIEPGAEMVRVYDWSSTFGSLVEGEYTLEIDLLTEGESEGKTYRIPFEIT